MVFWEFPDSILKASKIDTDKTCQAGYKVSTRRKTLKKKKTSPAIFLQCSLSPYGWLNTGTSFQEVVKPTSLRIPNSTGCGSEQSHLVGLALSRGWTRHLQDLFQYIWFHDFYRADPSPTDVFRTASSHICLLLFGWDSFHVRRHLAPAMTLGPPAVSVKKEIFSDILLSSYHFRMGYIWTCLSFHWVYQRSKQVA